MPPAGYGMLATSFRVTAGCSETGGKFESAKSTGSPGWSGDPSDKSSAFVFFDASVFARARPR